MNEATTTPADRFQEALVYTWQAHAGQVRKGTDIPYATHPTAVAVLVAEHGGDGDQQVAALLHDAAEDAGGLERMADIRRRFGDRIAGLVAACGEELAATDKADLDWWERKRRTVKEVATIDPAAGLVECADKVHNATCLLEDVRSHGPGTLTRFKGGIDGTCWYYRALARAFLTRSAEERNDGLTRLARRLTRLARDLTRAIDDFEEKEIP